MELAEEQGVTLPHDNIDDLKKILIPGDDCESLEDYLRVFDVTLLVMQEEEALERIAYELVEDCAAENVWYIEVRYSPILHTKKGLSLTQIVDAVLAGLKRGHADFGVVSGLIICGMRNLNPETSLLLAELTAAYKGRGVVAFDLAGAEEDYPAKKHEESFRLILSNNLNCTIHAGEGYGPSSIHQALHFCGAHRIGHGTRLKEDGDLLNYCNDHRIALEICPTSNVQTRVVSSIENHPLRFYFDYGLRITINTDNRLVSDTTVTKELDRVAKAHNFTVEEIRTILLYGFKSAFLGLREKRAMLNRAMAAINDILAEPEPNVPDTL
jgi:adenosine deaminase